MAINLNGGSGAPGSDGADGKTILNGNSAPSTSVGVDGDFYINTSSQEIYGPKSASAWGSPTDIVGADGSAGQDGITTIDYKGVYVSTSAYVPGNFVVHSAQTYIATASSTNSTPPSSSWDSFPFVTGGSGDVATDAIWNLKGDLAVGTGSDTASRLSAAPDGKVLMTASAEATGLTWSTPASGGNTTSTNAYASRPAAATNGNLFLPNNGYYLERDTGAAWAPWGPLYPLTTPVDGDFAWINQGGATVTTTNGGIYLLAPATAGVSMRIRKKTAPATPYSIIAMILPVYGRTGGSNNPLAGLTWRQSSDGKLVRYGFYQSAAGQIRVQHGKFTSATAISANYVDEIYAAQSFSPLWLKITDNGTNRLIFTGRDGQNWIQIDSQGRTDFMTADEVGWFVEAGGATYDAGATLISWKETS